MKSNKANIQTKDLTAIILAGGKSSRMGEDKATKLHQGLPFIHYIIKVLESFTSQILIVSDIAEHDQFGYTRIKDKISDKGPLGGIYTGLFHSKTSENIVVTCDIPFLIPEIIQNLLDKSQSLSFDASVYESDPLVGIYKKSITNDLLELIQNNQLSIRQSLLSIRTNFVSLNKELTPYITNINTPQHYKTALQWN